MHTTLLPVKCAFNDKQTKQKTEKMMSKPIDQTQDSKKPTLGQTACLSGQTLAFTSFLHAPYAAKPLRNALGLTKDAAAWGLTHRLSTPVGEIVREVIEKEFKEMAHLNTDCMARGIALPLGESKFCLVAGNYKNRLTPELSYWVLDIEKHVQQSEFSPATRKEPNKPIWVAVYKTENFDFNELAACEITEPPALLELLPELGHDDLLDPICFFHEKTKTLVFAPSLLCQLGSSILYLEAVKPSAALAHNVKAVVKSELVELEKILHRKGKTSFLSRLLGHSDNLYGVKRINNATQKLGTDSGKLGIKIEECTTLNLGLLATEKQLIAQTEPHLLEIPTRYARLSLSDEYTAWPTLETFEAYGLVGTEKGTGTSLIPAMQFRGMSFASQEFFESKDQAQDVLQKVQEIEGLSDDSIHAARLNVAPAGNLAHFLMDAFAPGYQRYDALREKLHYKTLSPLQKLKATLM